jgi:gamma-glutamyltranspeptidase/glutathione hydrolase
MKNVATFLCIIVMAMAGVAQDRLTGLPFATRSEVIAVNGMACTSQPLATQVALDILKAGGTAVDAAIAANAALGLMEPTGNGVGGDLFAIVWDAKTRKLYGLNASGRSPQSLSLDWFRKNGYTSIPARGALPVSVPGCVDGWYELHKRFGRLPMSQNLAPAIRYANEGFPMSELIAYYLEGSARLYKNEPNFADTWMPGGSTPAKGDVFRNPRLARTLQLIADGGRDAFYKGEIARKIDAHMKKVGGFLSYDDLAAHTSEWVDPVSVNYRGYDVWELPPNGQGIAALQMLEILEGYDLKKMGFGSVEYMHAFTEAKKLAFEDRAKFYADPAFSPTPLTALLDSGYAATRRQLITDRAAKVYPSGPLKPSDTIYLTVADKEGNMVSLIQSNFRGMGSGVVPGDLGFMLQNRGELFNLDPAHANAFAPGKRPFHTIIPAFVTKNGEPWLSFGVMGGDMQPLGHVQILVNLIDFGMNLQEAGDAPRMFHDGSSQPTGEVMTDGGILYLESGFPYESMLALQKKGHKIGFSTGQYGGYQAIMRDVKRGIYIGASESRKDGQAAGY